MKSTNIDSPQKMMIPQYLSNRRSVGTNCVKTGKVYMIVAAMFLYFDRKILLKKIILQVN